ncbi:hypothetical protein V6N12_052474 [Hibiscus sabdariffa]|uniref:Uncharacterized protein n=1 Tax=Hibiscus sabdariffa TaxID=183260 RepID=A0ABR2C1L8_9ROSI
MKQPNCLGQSQELPVKLTHWMISSHYLVALLQVSKQGFLHLGMDDGKVLLGEELAEIARRQYPEKFNRVHRFHVTVLSETLPMVLIGIKQGREVVIHVECLVVEPLKYFA